MAEAQTVSYPHIPVLLRETVDCFADFAESDRPLRFLDGTLGMGGHSEALLSAYPGIELLGLDRDTEALGVACGRLSVFGDRVHTRHCRFSRFDEAMDELGWTEVDGALIDIGVSSLQLDEACRGFSVHGDGPLDMRMDAQSGARSAKDIVNHGSMKELRDIIATYGEDPQAGRIARAICDARERAPIETTGRLAEVVSHAYPAAWRAKSRHHPATRTFQALRMVVNDELGELEAFLGAILGRLAMHGRLAVITFHSLEDRMVKQAMRRWAEGCRCPKYVPVCTCHHVPEVALLTKKPVTASEGELARNPRASSAKLRAAEKIALFRDDRLAGQDGRDAAEGTLRGGCA